MSNRHARKPRRPFGLKLRLHGPNEGEILDLAASTGERSLHRLDSVPRHVRSDLGCAPEWRGMCSGGVSLTRAVVDTSMERVLLCVVHERSPGGSTGIRRSRGFLMPPGVLPVPAAGPSLSGAQECNQSPWRGGTRGPSP